MRLLAIILALIAASLPLFAAVDWSLAATSAVNGPAVIASNKAIFSTYDGKIYALNADTGTTLWMRDAGGKVAFCAQAPNASSVAAITSTGTLLVLNAEKGNVACEAALGGMPTGFAAGGGRIYAALNGSVRAFDTSCKPLWSAPLRASTGQIGRDNSNIYVTAGGRLHSIASASGAINWAAGTGDSFLSTPVEYGGTVYIGSTDKKLYAIDRNSGNVRWAYQTGGWVMGTPKPVENAVYFSSNDGNVYAVDRSGNLLFKAGLPGGSWPQPETYTSESGTVAVFSANDGNIHAINGANGKEIWTFSSDGAPTQAVRYKQSFIFGTGAGTVYSLSSSPICSFTWPNRMESVGDWPVEIEGKASANGGIYAVEIRVAGGQWKIADGKEEWRAVAGMEDAPLGMVSIECRATDLSGKTEQGKYASTTLVKSENAPLQKMAVAAPPSVNVGEDFTVSVKDSRGNDLRGIKVAIGSETRTADSPVQVRLSKDGLNYVLLEKAGFEQSGFETRAKGQGSPLPLLALGAIAAAGAYLAFRKMKQK